MRRSKRCKQSARNCKYTKKFKRERKKKKGNSTLLCISPFTDIQETDILRTIVSRFSFCFRSNSGNRRGQPLSSVREKRHDELTMTAGHRITKFARGPGTSPEQLKAILHGVLGHVAAIMKRCNVDYWIVAGTLLGAQRHHGLIPWDNDVDVQLVHSQLEPLKQCLKTIWVGNEEAHFVWMFRTGLHSDIIPIKVADSRSGYYVDVFECHEDTKGGCHTKVFGWSTPLAYVTPTRLCMFDHLVVRCPNDPDRVLKNLYKKGIGILPQHRGLMPPGAVEHTAVQWAESNAEAFLSQ